MSAMDVRLVIAGLFVAVIMVLQYYIKKKQREDIESSDALLDKINAAKEPLVTNVTPLRDDGHNYEEQWTLMLADSLWMITKYDFSNTGESFYVSEITDTAYEKEFELYGKALDKVKDLIQAKYRKV